MNTETTLTSWSHLLSAEKNQPYFQKILASVKQAREAGRCIYPPQPEVFSALKYTPYDQVKVVILGQDPYHGPNQAHGLAFSVKPGVMIPPSLRNIFKELMADLNLPRPSTGCLTPWATQGVLLLNTILTVEEGLPQSHSHVGWQRFTDRVITCLNEHEHNIVFLLWGAHAQQKESLIDKNRHKILTAPHPSPLSASRGFLGCRHFSQANTLLTQLNRTPVNWILP